jgi:DNA modification methylase
LHQIEEKYLSSRAKFLCKIEGNIPIDLKIPNHSSILVISKSQRYLTHLIHKYPAKFIPEYPRWAIQKYAGDKTNLVLDPFCGSGTSNVEAKLAGYNSCGIDADPLARLLTKVKTTNLNEKKLEHTRESILENINKIKKEKKAPKNYEPFKMWFRPNIVHELLGLRNIIDDISDKKIHDFFLACFSATIRKVSNADPGLVLPKISKYMRIEEAEGRTIDVVKTFSKILNTNSKAITDFSKITSASTSVKIIGTDSRKIKAKDRSFSLAITSPPYLNAHDYVRAHKLELFWLQLIKEKDELGKLDKKYIGTEKYYAKEYSDIPTVGISELDKKIKLIQKVDRKRAYIVARFFLDMQIHFEEIHRILQDKGHYVMFVGNNIVRGNVIPTHQYLSDLAKKSGLRTELHFSSPLIKRMEVQAGRKDSGGFIADDQVLVFRK